MKIEITGLHHIAIICSDYSISKDFYLNILGFTLKAEVFRAERNSWKGNLILNGIYLIELFSFPDAPPRPSFPEAQGLRHLAFSVNDVLQTQLALQSFGIECEEIRIDEYTGKQFFFIQDPDGLPVEFYEL